MFILFIFIYLSIYRLGFRRWISKDYTFSDDFYSWNLCLANLEFFLASGGNIHTEAMKYVPVLARPWITPKAFWLCNTRSIVGGEVRWAGRGWGGRGWILFTWWIPDQNWWWANFLFGTMGKRSRTIKIFGFLGVVVNPQVQLDWICSQYANTALGLSLRC